MKALVSQLLWYFPSKIYHAMAICQKYKLGFVLIHITICINHLWENVCHITFTFYEMLLDQCCLMKVIREKIFAFHYCKTLSCAFFGPKVQLENLQIQLLIPPVDLHWFFEISNRTEKKNSVGTEKKFQLVHNWIFIPVWNDCQNGYFKKPVEINRG